MTRRRPAWRLIGDRRGSTAVEFAMVALPLFLVSFAALDLGFYLWTKSALQSVAADAARCGAINAAACTGSNSVTSFVTSDASQWVLSTVVPELTVKVNTNVSSTACPTITVGSYETVEISTSFLGEFLIGLPHLSNFSIDVCASYPKKS